jgi:hypothetical protein
MKNYWINKHEEKELYPPWNTENYYTWDFGDEDFEPTAEPIKYPKIYGFKTPEKHRFIFVDGEPAKDRKWKRMEIKPSTSA